MDALYAAADAKLAEFRALASAPPRVASLADEAAAAQADFLDAHRALYAADDGSGDALLLCVGCIAGNPGVIFSGLQGAVHSSSEYAERERRYAAAFQRCRGAQLALAAIAPSFAGPPAQSQAIAIDVDESWAGLTAPYDVLTLRNDSGRTLTDCVVRVTLTGADGGKADNVHYIAEWRPGAVQAAHYGLGASIGGQQLARQTVYSIQSVVVSVWSPQLRVEGVTYPYNGPERDADIKRLLEGKLHFDARAVDAGIINLVPRIDLTLRGVPAIPEHAITVEFRHGGDRLTRTWRGLYSPYSPVGYIDTDTLDSEARANMMIWREGQTRSFQPDPPLPWMPESIMVRLTFEATSYSWEQSITLPAQHRPGH